MPIQHSSFLFNKKNRIMFIRTISKYLHKDVSAKEVRQKFLDYFVKGKDHKFVKSSPVVPYCDPTVPFVNAGMNQFKGIFLGVQNPQYPRVANSQKCIRIGGKHNDLNVVGKDGYHHTFFEMLGNWSFGDYFKNEGCEMAWEVLTKVYGLPASRLYVTYFGGNEKLQLPEDTETKEIWKSLGVHQDRILPFGLKDNFWEMGLTGPCGPCTEIHYDHRGDQNRADLVNKGLHDLTEIWNIVFIQFNRNPNGTIQPLPKKHIDTGMGFERLVCALQRKTSSYDTDNFSYLINAIHKNCRNLPKYSGNFGESDWNSIDQSYRIMADHIRMITISLGDGVIPEGNRKLRRILRKCFFLGESVFNHNKGFVKELTNYVVGNLGPVYPELERNFGQIQQIIEYEEEIYHSNKKLAEKDWNKLLTENAKLLEIDISEVTPNFITAYKELKTAPYDTITDELAFRFYDTYGLDEYQVEQLSKVLGKQFKTEDFYRGFEKAKISSKKNSISKVEINLSDKSIPATDDSFKYIYEKTEKGTYNFPTVECQILKIIQNNEEVLEAQNNILCSLVLDQTNFYSTAGGQESDKGTINFENAQFLVKNTEKINDVIIHHGFTKDGLIKTGLKGVLTIDKEVRVANMRNHTSTHILNAAIKNVKKATCQKSSKVNSSYLNLDVAIFGTKLDIKDVIKLEEELHNVIFRKVNVVTSNVNSQELYNLDSVTLIPGEIYPENNIRIVEVNDQHNLVSREPCCGTHVLNTADIDDFCIIGLKSLGRSTHSITAVTGERAKLARENQKQFAQEITELKNRLLDSKNKVAALESAASELKQRLQFNPQDETILPLVFRYFTLEELDDINMQLKQSNRDQLKMFIDMEMQEALRSNISQTKSKTKYLVHYLRSSIMLESVSLTRATRQCPDIPRLIIGYSENVVTARCCVPKQYQSPTFNAEKWLSKTIGDVFKSRVVPPKGQDLAEVCNMRAKKVHATEWDTLLSKGIKMAKQCIDEKL